MHNGANEPALYWCIGFYASASTWLFNAAKKIAAAAGLQPGLASAFVSVADELIFPRETRTAIVKTHETDERSARVLSGRSEAIWLSVRHPNDCVASLMLYQACAFDEALDMVADSVLAGLSVLRHPRTRLFRFEDNFFDDRQTLDIIAAGFGHMLAEADRARIYAETRRSAIESFIAGFPHVPTVVAQAEPAHFVDLDTQWHSHHAGRDGAVGRWRRMLTAEQSAAVRDRVGGAMDVLGYDR